MNKTGYVFSLIGGVLAVVFSVLLVITGPYFFVGSDVSRFISANSEVQPDGNTNLGLMWTDIGDYYGLDPILKGSLDDYISDYQDVLQDISADDIDDMADKYDMDPFHKLAVLFEKVENYLPALAAGIIACLASSIVALVGAQVARRYKAAGGAMVLSAAALTLIFSLIASSILPMALASLLLVLGGLLQLAKPKESAALSGQQEVKDGGVY